MRKRRYVIAMLLAILLMSALSAATMAEEDAGSAYVLDLLNAVEKNDLAAISALFTPSPLTEAELAAGTEALTALWTSQPFTVHREKGGSVSIVTHHIQGEKVGTERFSEANYSLVTESGTYRVRMEYVTVEPAKREGGAPYDAPEGLLWFHLTDPAGNSGAIAGKAVQELISCIPLRPFLAALALLCLALTCICCLGCRREKPLHWKGWMAVILLLHMGISAGTRHGDGSFFVFPIISFAYLPQFFDNLHNSISYLVVLPIGPALYGISKLKRGRNAAAAAEDGLPMESEAAEPAAVANKEDTAPDVSGEPDTHTPYKPSQVYRFRWLALLPPLGLLLFPILFENTYQKRKNWLLRLVLSVLAASFAMIITMLAAVPALYRLGLDESENISILLMLTIVSVSFNTVVLIMDWLFRKQDGETGKKKSQSRRKTGS